MVALTSVVPDKRTRPRSHVGLVAGAAAAALLLVYLALWLGLPGSFRIGNDFAPTYVAGRYVLDGQGASIYRQDLIVAAERAAAPAGSQVDLPFISPPAAALLASPLSKLSFPSAEVVYSLVQLLATIAAAALIATKVRWPATAPAAFRCAVAAVAVGAPTVGALLLYGESDGLFTLAVTVGYLMLTRRQPLGAGIALGLAAGLGKPHLLIGVLVFLLFRRAFTEVVACVATAVAVNLVAVAVLGPATALGFVGAVMHSGVDHPPSGLEGMVGLVSSWLGNGAGARALGLLGAAMAIALCARLGVVSRRRPARTPSLLAAAFALNLLGSPHLLTPDVVLLVPAFIWLYCEVLGRAPASRVTALEVLLVGAWVCLGAATIMDAGNGAIGFPGRVTPWGLILFAVVAWRAIPRAVVVSAGDGGGPTAIDSSSGSRGETVQHGAPSISRVQPPSTR